MLSKFMGLQKEFLYTTLRQILIGEHNETL